MSRISLGITLSMVALVIAIGGIAGYFMPVSGIWSVTDRAYMVLHFFDGRMRVFWITSDRDRFLVRRSLVAGPDLWVEMQPGGRGPSPRRARADAQAPSGWDRPFTARGSQMADQDSPAADEDGWLDRLGPSAVATSFQAAAGARSDRPRTLRPGIAPPSNGDQFPIRIGARNAVPPFGGQWRKGAVIPQPFSAKIEVSYVRMPVWLPVVVLLLQPIRAIVFGPWLRRRRERLNLCLACGYERIGLTEPRCPECGTPHADEVRR
jgi:hypothetical protein